VPQHYYLLDTLVLNLLLHLYWIIKEKKNSMGPTGSDLIGVRYREGTSRATWDEQPVKNEQFEQEVLHT